MCPDIASILKMSIGAGIARLVNIFSIVLLFIAISKSVITDSQHWMPIWVIIAIGSFIEMHTEFVSGLVILIRCLVSMRLWNMTAVGNKSARKIYRAILSTRPQPRVDENSSPSGDVDD